MKELSIEEVELLTEMKDRCLKKGLYIDEKAEEKFKMLCHLEDFSIQYYELQNNWNELKNWLIQLQKFKGINQQGFSWGVAQEILEKMQELEQGKDE